MRLGMAAARWLAIAIAIAAAIDPPVTSSRRTTPEIALIGSDPESIRSVERALRRDYALVRGPYSKASATVIVGASAPSFPRELASPVFVVSAAPPGVDVAIDAMRAPAAASADARVPVDVVARVSGAAARTLTATLVVGGVAVDRATRRAPAAGRIVIPLSFVPTTSGAITARAVVRLEGASDSSVADVGVQVRDRRWAVLFFDRRPSWMSTFVRRSLTNDRRFAVASRVVTSRGISTDAGAPPSTLEDPTLLELYDAIVVGAPESLTSRDVAGLEAFLRRRGGGVVLLFDSRETTGASATLMRVARWSASAAAATAVVRADGDSSGLRAGEMIWPTVLPPASDVIAFAASGAAPAARRPIIWRAPVGAGQMIVSGALDSWKYRDAGTSGFDRFWRSTIAAVADGAIPPVEVRVGRATVRPGETIDLTVRLRDAALMGRGAATGSAAATLVGENTTPSAIRLWPGGSIGTLAGSVRAPARFGGYRIRVAADGAIAEVPIVVTEAATGATPDQRDVLAALAGSRGGAVVAMEELGAALGRVVKSEPRVERWHPMRSGWWMVPFVVLLGAEWLWRRKTGYA